MVHGPTQAIDITCIKQFIASSSLIQPYAFDNKLFHSIDWFLVYQALTLLSLMLCSSDPLTFPLLQPLDSHSYSFHFIRALFSLLVGFLSKQKHKYDLMHTPSFIIRCRSFKFTTNRLLNTRPTRLDKTHIYISVCSCTFPLSHAITLRL